MIRNLSLELERFLFYYRFAAPGSYTLIGGTFGILSRYDFGALILIKPLLHTFCNDTIE